jgi:hypothetical protein
VKTTKGKTKPVKAGERVVHIYRLDGNKLLAVRVASSLKMALKSHYDETLVKHGYTGPVLKGNVLTVKSKRGDTVRFRALEAYQSA